ncbi:GntR family transcriptional regulator [Acrocarpospora pleiomorpha]|uniref:GntR family transcriptional regulator n=1 Tax=Acrocarpospora pleiomorpha TaxID=90975 RepID=A0A5M3XRD9_9ACTN|nr:GntR family transcriptional regulator [Acrocarpospora pleiomorpha]GES23897.1 GntR family transcriptional regulator [Acrocarpospora pleiomorpha]
MTSVVSVATSLSSQLREMLLDGELAPGEPVRQEALAKHFGVSRVPVREALRMLESEGIVKHTPNAGYTITKLTESELKQTYIVREALETELIRAMPEVEEIDLDILRTLNDEMAAYVSAGNVGAANVTNRRFHFKIFDLCGLSLVTSFVEMAWARAAPYHILVLSAPEQAPRIFDEHLIMIEQIRTHDIDGLLATIDHHRVTGQNRVMQTLQLLRRHGRDLTEHS